MVRPLLIDRRLGGAQRCLHSVKLACTWYRVLKDFYVSHLNHTLECIDYCVCFCSVLFQDDIYFRPSASSHPQKNAPRTMYMDIFKKRHPHLANAMNNVLTQMYI